jgi:N-acetyl-gamma-glutamyl-phosphate reductase
MIRVGVIGATGYAGAELVRILAGHPKVKLSVLTSRQYAGVSFSKIYPAMAGRVDMDCRTYSADLVCDTVDILFTALPHKLPMEIIPDLIQNGKRVIDLSADFRFKDPTLYEKHYQPHAAKGLLNRAVYGLSEIYFDEIKHSDLIGNPGCYPTSVLLPLIPLIKAGLIDSDDIIADSKSGVSGAGRSPSLTTHFCEVNESFKAYKIAAHRHNPEMNEILSLQAQQPVAITFVPHLVPMSRGMETTLYATASQGAKLTDIRNTIAVYYAQRPFIRVISDDRTADTLHVKGTNFCDISVHLDEITGRVILTSVIDNLVKGAAGQAVQNMNIMLGIDETEGLMTLPYPL